MDAGIVDANINSMQVFCDSRGIALRRHAKTHKSVDVGRRQLAAGAAGLTVATVGEGEVFADLLAEFGKISLSPTQSQLHRAACGNWLAVCRRSSALTPVTECGERPRQASPYRSRSTPGRRRSGVAPNDAGELASLARPLGLRVNGVFTFPGHGYGLGAARLSAAADEGRLLDAPQPATWTGRRDRALLTLAVQTGLRISELTTLSTSDILILGPART